MTQRVAIYARYSSDRQKDASIEDQVRVCRTHADREGWTIAETYADRAISGAIREREHYQALLEGVRQGRFDIVLAESLDRFSRDQVDTINLGQLCRFHDVRIHTLAEGAVSKTDVGLKSLMGSIYLDDLSAKTSRGLKGRVLSGRGVGTPPYGYVVIKRLNSAGEPDRGLRASNPKQAAIVQRIFEQYADGVSPRQIAKRLNEEGVPGPRGSIWYDASIRGRPKREDGILRNHLYNGRQIWGRRHNRKDPDTGHTVRRASAGRDVVIKDMPDLKIIDNMLWRAFRRAYWPKRHR